jgi:phosphoserine phosphatase
MNNVATLIVKNQSPNRLHKGVAVARQLIEEAGATVIGMDWLSPDEAVDLFFSGASPAVINPLLGNSMRQLQIDSFAWSQASRKARMLVADMDSTMIEVECIDELAAALGLKDQIAPITEAAMSGQIDFEEALRARVRLIAGLEVEQMARIREQRLSYSPGAKILVATMKKAGATTLLVSGGFTYFSDSVARGLGFDEARANCLEIKKGRVTGRLIRPILTASSKRSALIEVRDGRGIPSDQTLAIGDGANDIAMMEEAGLGIAYHAKATTAAAADARIDFAGLEAALFFQGYRRSEFVTG